MKPTKNKPGYFQRFQTLAMNRMAPGVVIEKDSLTYWRVRILFAIVLTGLLIGLFAFVPVVALVIKQKLWGMLLFDAVAFPVGISLLLSRRLRYEIRAAITLIYFYALGLVIIISVGPLSGGPIWLFAFAVLVGVLLGAKAGIIAIVVNAITITITGWLISAGIFGQTFPFFDNMETMIATGASFMLLNTIAAISVAVLVKGLVSTHQKEEALYSTLKKERLHLIEAKEKLVHEVEERLHAEEVLRESEEKHRLLAENTIDCIWQMNLDMEFTYINQAVLPFLGYTPKEFIGSKLQEHCSSEEMEKMQAIILDAFSNLPDKTETVFETSFYHKNGEEIPCEIIGKIILDDAGNPIYIQGANRNITERRLAEENLRESERLYRLLADNVNDNIWTMDMEMKFTYISPSITRMRGYSVEEAMALPIEEGMTPASLDIAMRALTEELELHNKVQKPQDRSRKVEIELNCKDGSTIWTETEANFIYDADGQPQSIIGVTRDIAERKRTEKALLFTQFAIDHFSDAAFWMGNDGRFFYVNEASCNELGYSREELLEMTVHDIDPDFPEEVWEDHWADLKSRGSLLIESHHRTKDGEVFPVELKLNHLEFDGNEYNCAFARNIMDRKQHEKALRESEEKLARSKKMESLGLLAGGVAHDLNNVLSGIVSYPELILMDLPEDSKLRNPIETIQESGNRAAEIVQDLLTVARGVATTKGPLNLNDLIGDYLHSPEFNKLKEFHPTAKVEANLDTDLFNINGSPVHIRKVVMNLVSNATEAIEGSGNVTISTVNRYLDRPLRGYDDVNIGEYAILSVSDDGSGISSDDLERIFEPFYTKKVLGRSGTGLGLAVVWNTVQDHKGYIDVTSHQDGTTFELYFPITRDELSGKGLSKHIKDYQGNQEMILVVDDMENQREISCKMLDKLGYKTNAVSSGEEAVEYLQENKADLILLDMIMDPGINGRETYERIIKIHPKQKAIIVSGFAQTDEVKEAQKLGAGQYIKKPVTLEKIGIAVKEELGNGSRLGLET